MFMENKIKVKLIGENGNIFNLVGITVKALNKNGQREEAKEMSDKVFNSKSYEEALMIISNYVEII